MIWNIGIVEDRTVRFWGSINAQEINAIHRTIVVLHGKKDYRRVVCCVQKGMAIDCVLNAVWDIIKEEEPVEEDCVFLVHRWDLERFG